MSEIDAEVDRMSGPLSEPDAQAVLRLSRSAEHADGVEPLSEQPRLWLQDPNAEVVHLLVRAEQELAGYAQIDLGSPGTASAELMVHPLARNHGVGTALVKTATSETQERALSIWAHGALPTARSLASELGLVVVRELWSMGRDLTTFEQVDPRLPDGAVARPFVVGQDEQAWLSQNAEAFVHHPEQGRLTLSDLEARMREDWFDAGDFWLVEQDGELLGSIWTKVVGDVGEIYAVGVRPRAQGQGLGRALTNVGLNHLAASGIPDVVLYVDADNVAAVATYLATDFERRTVSVQFGQPHSTK